MEKKERVLSISFNETNRKSQPIKEIKENTIKISNNICETKFKNDINSFEIEYDAITLKGKIA